MKVIFFVLVLVVAGVVGLGFWLGWFHIGSDNDDGNSNVTFSVNTNKFKEDMKTAGAKVKGAGHQEKDKVAGLGEKTMDGTVVSVSGDQLRMTNKDEKELSHPLGANVKVTCDGKTCTAADLKAGMRIRVTTEKAAPHAAIRIEALDNNRDFEKGV